MKQCEQTMKTYENIQGQAKQNKHLKKTLTFVA